ncbi:hypothetical protein DFP73DRAFT_525267 [Morchella snyderi]|nr:hypothetical protein DFP73DRAFT_525267 [Morchella snyderi]
MYRLACFLVLEHAALNPSEALPPFIHGQMGNLCGKETSTSTAPPGRVLGSAPATLSSTNAHTATTASRPKNPRKPKVTGPGRTLGDASVRSEESSGSAASPPPDARTAAALAAEKRLNDAQKGGPGKIQG